MKFKYIFFYLLYLIILFFSYKYFVSDIYDYYGLIYTPNYNKMIFAILMNLTIFYLVIKRRKASNNLLYIMHINLFTPLAMYYWMTNESSLFILNIYIVFFLTIIITNLMRPIKVTRLPISLKYRVDSILFSGTFIIFVLFVLKYGAFDTRSLHLQQLYELRSEKTYAGIWAYLSNWLSKVFIPVLLVISYFKKKYLLLIVSLCMQIVLFTSTGSKTLLFSGFFIVSTCYLLSKKELIIGLPILYSLLIVLGIFYYKIKSSVTILSIFPTRQLFIPAQISFQHYDFFRFREKLYFSEGIIGKILGIDSPYSKKSTFLVGDGKSNSNTGLFTDAYDNGDFFFIYLYAIILILILIYINSISNYWSNNPIFTGVFVYTMIILTDGSLLTTLLTWGLVIILIIILFIEPEKEEYNAKT